ncbi:uncharacterized protein LOC133012232 [Limanda limanda]|uniref:uncharacterized protein LOC133012232 n=1 Tax=Limanda limanda TaxID=27771 RepID=UPI0029C7094B|nr:uncharacterized protein LOC133012232 [Limanda limanda]
MLTCFPSRLPTQFGKFQSRQKSAAIAVHWLVEGQDAETVIGLISINNLALNTKKLILDFRKKGGTKACIHINGTEVERVTSFKFLGVQISEDLSWTLNTSTLVKKAHQCLFCLRRMKKAHLSPQILVNVYHCTIESILTSCISVWCNPTGTKRTWQQLKMKYKNVVQTANRKKAEARKTGGGPPPPPLTEAEKMALSQNSGRPIAEGISGGSSSDPPTPQVTGAYIRVTDGVICLVEPSAITDLHAVEDDEETLSAATEREDAERPAESHAGNYNGEEGPSTSTAQLTSLPVKQLYKVYLESQINKSHLEMEHIRLQITKTEKEIQLLDHQLKEIKKTS